MTETSPDVSLTIFAGIDTHKDTHHAAIIDYLGREIADRQFPATATGYQALLAWLNGTGITARVGVEGTGSYGSALAMVLQAAGIDVVDVDRTDRRSRRFHGKSDTLDAYSAARLAASGGAAPSRRRTTATSRQFASCTTPAAPQSNLAPKRSPVSNPPSSTHQKRSGNSYAPSPAPRW